MAKDKSKNRRIDSGWLVGLRVFSRSVIFSLPSEADKSLRMLAFLLMADTTGRFVSVYSSFFVSAGFSVSSPAKAAAVVSAA